MFLLCPRGSSGGERDTRAIPQPFFDILRPRFNLLWLRIAGENERQEQISAASSGRHQRQRPAAGRAHQRDIESLAVDHGASVGCFTQYVHARLRRLFGSILLGSNHRRRANIAAHRRLHRHHPQKGSSFDSDCFLIDSPTQSIVFTSLQKQAKDHFGIEGDEGSNIVEDSVSPFK